MDDEVFRSVKAQFGADKGQSVCVYEKSLQHRHYGCHHAYSVQIGERQAEICAADRAHSRCRIFLASVVQASGFALRRSGLPAHLPFAQAMKAQVGGLNGVMEGVLKLNPKARPSALTSSGVALIDIDRLLSAAAEKAGSLDQVKLSSLMPAVSRFEVARRRPARRR